MALHLIVFLVGIYSESKFHFNYRYAVANGSLHFLEVIQFIDRFLQRIDDLAFDILRRSARIDSNDQHVGDLKGRIFPLGHRQEGRNAQNHQQHKSGQGKLVIID